MTGEGEEEDLESKTPVTPDAPDALKGLFEKRRTVLAVIVSDLEIQSVYLAFSSRYFSRYFQILPVEGIISRW